MKKFAIRILKLVDQVDPINNEVIGEGLELQPGEFKHDKEAWDSITASGKYILLPVCSFEADATETKPANNGNQEQP